MEAPKDGEECTKRKIIKIEPEEAEEDNCDQWLKESSECPGGENSELSPLLKVEKIEDHSTDEDTYSTYSVYYEDIYDFGDTAHETYTDPTKKNAGDT